MKHIKIGRWLINSAHITHVDFEGQEYDLEEKQYIPAIIIYLANTEGKVNYNIGGVGTIDPVSLVFRKTDFDLYALENELLELFDYVEIG